MTSLFKKMLNDEAGFLLSAELMLISTVLVLGMVVGLSEVSHAINNELFDVANAFDSVNQSYRSTACSMITAAQTAATTTTTATTSVAEATKPLVFQMLR